MTISRLEDSFSRVLDSYDRGHAVMKRMSRMEGEKPTLMIIPMIDIIFSLLVFFMISTIYTIPQQSLSIMLPKTKTQQSAELRPVLIDFENLGS